MKITGNEPVNPVSSIGLDKNKKVIYDHMNGLTIRHQFAMAAMQGMLANSEITKLINTEIELAEIAVEHADALINELNKTDHANG